MRKLLSVFLFINLIVGCRKIDIRQDVVPGSSNYYNAFFKTNGLDPNIDRFVQTLKKDKVFVENLDAFVRKNGLPRWDRTLFDVQKTISQKKDKKLAGNLKESADSINAGLFFTPLTDDANNVTAYLVTTRYNDSVYRYRLYNRAEVEKRIVSNTEAQKKILFPFAYFEKQLNGNAVTEFKPLRAYLSASLEQECQLDTVHRNRVQIFL